MVFDTPTTILEMYEILKEIFVYFRIRREKYDGVVLDMISLERMEQTDVTDLELIDTATTLLSAEHAKEILEYKNSLTSEIQAINKKIEAIPQSVLTVTQTIINGYEESERKIEQLAIKNGLVNSGVILDKLCSLEQNKNSELNAVKSESEKNLAELNAQLSILEDKLKNADSYFQQIHEKSIQAKVLELKTEQEKARQEVFKFNCAQDEKEQRYANDILKTNASFEMRFMELTTDEFTKDQLVEMGYYENVVECVSAYFDTLEPVEAYNTIKKQGRLAIYLEDYYTNVINMYAMRAGVGVN